MVDGFTKSGGNLHFPWLAPSNEPEKQDQLDGSTPTSQLLEFSSNVSLNTSRVCDSKLRCRYPGSIDFGYLSKKSQVM